MFIKIIKMLLKLVEISVFLHDDNLHIMLKIGNTTIVDYYIDLIPDENQKKKEGVSLKDGIV